MPVFHRPRTVVVSDDGSSPLAAVAVLIGLAIVASAASAILADMLTAVLIMLAAAVTGSLGVLAMILRRTGSGISPRGREVRQPARVPELAARPQRPAIGGPAARPSVIPGEVISRQN